MADVKSFYAQAQQYLNELKLLPPRWYVAAITDSQLKTTRAGDGAYLEVELTILEGPNRGRKLWDRLNVRNRSEVAVKVGRSRLAAIWAAVAVINPTDSSELHGIPLEIKVTEKRREDTGEVRNYIAAYAKRAAAAPPR